MNNRPYNMDQCHLSRDLRRRRETPHWCFEASQVTIKVKLYPLESVPIFSYLRHTIEYNNRNLEALYNNL